MTSSSLRYLFFSEDRNYGIWEPFVPYADTVTEVSQGSERLSTPVFYDSSMFAWS